MTIIMKPSIVIKKPDGTKSPLVLDECTCDEEKHDMYPSAPEWRPAKRSSGALLCMTIVALLVTVTGITCGLMLYRQYLRSSALHRYQGYCSIPIDTREQFQEAQERLIERNYREHRVMPLTWTSGPDPDSMQIISTADEGTSDDIVTSLREQFDIGDRVEKIRVFDNGRTISFIHDFDDNVTGIVDKERCFMMELDPTLVLPPDTLVLGIERGGSFDVTRVRSTLRAVLPALRLRLLSRALADQCRDKPVYRLQKEGVIIRKRSVDAPPHDYIQFAGKSVQEIEIANLAELLDFEMKQGQA